MSFRPGFFCYETKDYTFNDLFLKNLVLLTNCGLGLTRKDYFAMWL